MLNCTDKFLKYSERVGARFAEHNAGAYLSSLNLLFLMTCDVETAAGQMKPN